MTPQEFISRISRGELPALVYFVGEERFWAEEGVREMEKRLFAPGEEAFGKIVRSAQGLEPEEILVEMATPSFFGTGRLIVLREIDKASQALEEALVKGLAQLAEGTRFVAQGEKLDKRKSLAKELMNRGWMVECAPLKPYQAQEWAVAEARRQGLEMDQRIARMLVERKGTSPALLREEIAKAAVYRNGEGKLAPEEWEVLIGGSTETDIFGLLDGVALRQTGKALALLDQLLLMGEPELKILFMIGKQLHQLVWAVQLRSSGGTVRQLQQELGCHPYVADKTWEQAKAFNLARLTEAVERIVQAEYNIKTGRREPRWELEMAIVDLTELSSD